MLHTVAGARYSGDLVFAAHRAELHRFAAKISETVENDREKIFNEWRAFSQHPSATVIFKRN